MAGGGGVAAIIMTMQTALSMYKEEILCFLMEKVDILGTAP